MEFCNNIFVAGNEASDTVLLCDYLTHALDCRCSCVTIKELETLDSKKIQDNIMLLIDATDLLASDLVDTLSAINQNSSESKVAFFNVDSNICCDQLLLWPQVRGVFFDEVDTSNIAEGIKKILENQYWMPRKVMAQFLEHLHNKPEIHSSLNQLTKRESHILKQICDGFSNIEIANDLNVSLSTVKTHTYNLFKKLKVSNRVQAANVMRKLAVSERLRA